MKAFQSIRWRLQVWHGLILLGVLGGFGLTAHGLQRANAMRRADAELERGLRPLLEELRPGPGGPGFPGPPRGGPGPGGGPRPPRGEMGPMGEDPRGMRKREEPMAEGFYHVVWRPDGSEAFRSTNAAGPVPSPQADGRAAPGAALRSRGTLREIFEVTPGGGCVLLGRSLEPELSALRQSALILGGLGGGIWALGLAGGWWLASRAIRPIETISATAMRIADGDLAQRIDATETESELGRLAAVLNSTFARLEAAFAQQARFTSDAAHELRTPVTVILTQIQGVLRRERPAEDYRAALESCGRAADRMRRLMESLLELARLDSGQEPFTRRRMDLAEVAAECVELVRPLAEEKGIRMESALPSAICLGDPERLGQVVTNLLTNAIHYNKPGGAIRVWTTQKEGWVSLSAQDTGVGIGPEDLPRLFERFYRADKSRTAGRAGLGLAICKAIVDGHGGRIEVESKPGEGSCFSVWLPAAPAARAGEESAT